MVQFRSLLLPFHQIAQINNLLVVANFPAYSLRREVLNMSPRLAVDDALRDTKRTFEESMQPFVTPTLLSVKPTHFENLRFSELMTGIFFPSPADVPFFSPHSAKRFGLRDKPAFFKRVLSVVFRSSCKQMVRSNTGGSIAVVANENTIRDFTIRQFPRIAVRVYSLMSRRKCSVATFSFASHPKPATFFGFFESAPKSLNIGHIPHNTFSYTN